MEPTLRERQAESIRQEIRRQFIHLVVERGVDGFTFQDLAEATGISKRTLYRYFRDRDAIIEEIRTTDLPALERKTMGRAGSLREFGMNPDLAADAFEIFERDAEMVKAMKVLGIAGYDGRTSRERTALTKRIVRGMPGVHPEAAEQLAGLIRLLLGSDAWARLRQEDIDLEPREAGYAVQWAAQALMNAAVGIEGPLRPGVTGTPGNGSGAHHDSAS